MLLPLLIITAVLIGGWIFTAISPAWVRDPRESAQPSVFPNGQFSLWSLVLFLFFRSNLATSPPSTSLPRA